MQIKLVFILLLIVFIVSFWSQNELNLKINIMCILIVFLLCFTAVILLVGLINDYSIKKDSKKKKDDVDVDIDVDMTGYVPYPKGHSNMPYNPNWKGGHHKVSKNYNIR